MYEWIEIADKLIWLIKPIQWYTAAVSQNRPHLGAIVHCIMIIKWWHWKLLNPFLLKFIGMKMLAVFHYKVKLMQVYGDLKKCHFFGWLLKELVEF